MSGPLHVLDGYFFHVESSPPEIPNVGQHLSLHLGVDIELASLHVLLNLHKVLLAGDEHYLVC